MALNLLAEIRMFRPRPQTLRGASSEPVISGTYWGNFSILGVSRLEWFARRPPEHDVANCELIIDNTGGRFEALFDNAIWGFGLLTVWAGYGNDFDNNYDGHPDEQSPALIWQGRILIEGGLLRRTPDTAFLRASSDLYHTNPTVLSASATVGDARGFDRSIPLVMGDWQSQRSLQPHHVVPAINTSFGGAQGDGGDWSLAQGPIESIGSYYKAGIDPRDRLDGASLDSLDISSYVSTSLLGTSATDEATFSIDGQVSGRYLGYTPQGVWVKMKGLKTTATQGVPGLATGTFMDRVRDQCVWFLRYRLGLPLVSIDTATFRALPAYSGRNYFPNQRPLQAVLTEIEHDLAFDMVWLFGARGSGQQRPQLMAVRKGQGRILSGWYPDRSLLADSVLGLDRLPVYENVLLGYYDYTASFRSLSGSRQQRLAVSQAELGRVGFAYSRLREYNWLYNTPDVTAVQQLYLGHYGEWPVERVSFYTTLDYLDIQPTDRLILEPEKDTNAQGTRYLHVEEVALDWPRQLLRIIGYKGARQST